MKFIHCHSNVCAIFLHTNIDHWNTKVAMNSISDNSITSYYCNFIQAFHMQHINLCRMNVKNVKQVENIVCGYLTIKGQFE